MAVKVGRAGKAVKSEIKRIINADHRDPFSVLGIHETDAGVAIRCFNPESAEVAVIDIYDRKARYQMKKTDPAGFFEVVIPGRKIFAYDLHMVTYRGEHTINRDPYSFLPSLGEIDLHLFNEGNHYEIHKKLGAHIVEIDGVSGVRFAVWAPNAKRVSVVGDFCRWDGRRYCMRMLGSSGVWEIFIPGPGRGTLYKYEIKAQNGDLFDKADPYAYASELRPKTASAVWDMGSYQWDDDEWLSRRGQTDILNSPMSIYEAHLGSWARNADNEWLTYRELA
ncbi:1,4-alpha-glucan (glycogen) branching enzyme, GH-13-type, partial [hydrothermal vent metagenome]